MKVHPIARALGAPLLALLLTAVGLVPAAPAQSVDAVVDAMKARYQEQLETVDTYIMETDAYTSYHRKVTHNGEATYETQTRWGDQEGLFGQGANTMPSPQPGLSQLDELAQHASYLGTETLDGQSVHVLRVDDPSVLAPEEEQTPDEMTGEMRLYIDADRHVPLMMEYDVEIEEGGQVREMHPRITMSDYRTVDGLTLPWMMQMRMEDLDASISPEEREEARQGLEEMEAQMAEMPAEQREMMEGMMDNQMEQLRQILDEGTIEFTVEVQDVQVNVPIPDGVFGE